MVYRILQMHDGLIDVASVEGRGTTVTIRLPVWEP
jgi:signal transduction histidine kinase